jgi:hypothetical protein
VLQCKKGCRDKAKEEEMSKLTELGEVLDEEHFRILVPICGLENRITGRRA